MCNTDPLLSSDANYTVRVSSRARYARLQFSLADGLVVVVPRGFDLALIPALLARNRRWLERAATWVDAQRRCYQLAPPYELPSSLELRAVAQRWAVEYRGSDAERPVLVEHEGKLLVFCDVAEPEACFAALQHWLAAVARKHLKPWLLGLAGARGFSVHGAAIRAQRTRWASCSSSKLINLNLKLLFLPPQLVEYTMLHELCHTVHMDHSQRFWALLQQQVPNSLALDQQLKNAWRYVPPWLDSR